MEGPASVSGSCVICSLKQRPFHDRSYEEKARIIGIGRPRPPMKTLITKARGKVLYTRHFNIKEYEKYSWLTGSAKLNKLFCWPCLLYASTWDPSIWCRAGVDNLNGLYNALKLHAHSQNHICSVVKINTFGSMSVDLQLNEQRRLDILQHNETVTKNREVLQRFISSVCSLSKTEVPFRGYNESEALLNHGAFLEFLGALSKFDPVLRTHLETTSVFRRSSSRTQNELIQCIGTVVLNKIKDEIEETVFVSILLGETTDVMTKTQLSTVLRYVDKDGLAQERFLGFKDVGAKKDAAALLEHVVEIVEEFKLEGKLVAQSYDGAALMAGQLSGLCTQVLEKYPSALFVHCFAQRLNLDLQKVCSNVPECRVFFSTLSGLAAFVSKSPKRREALKLFMMRKLPRVAPTRWCFTSRLVHTVHEFQPQLIEFCEYVIEHDSDWDDDTICKAHGFLGFLTSFSNTFLLVAFAELFTYTDHLYSGLQTKQFEIGHCYELVLETKKLVALERYNFDAIWEDAWRKGEVFDKDNDEPRLKRRKPLEDPKDSFKRLLFKIIDLISNQISDSYASMEKLKFVNLLNPKKFLDHKAKFPEKSLQTLLDTYPKIFDSVSLKSELAAMYKLDEFRDKMPHELVPYMLSVNLKKAMPELYKLACLFLTLPSTTASEERSFLAFKRIQSYERTTQGQERLSKLALLSIELSVLCKLRESPDFFSKVIEEFTKHDGRMEFIFK